MGPCQEAAPLASGAAGVWQRGGGRVRVGLCPPCRRPAPARLTERERPWALLDSSPLLGPLTGSSSRELPFGGRAMWSSAQKRGGGVQQRPIFQPHPSPPVCAQHGVPGPRSAAAVTLVREGTRPEEGVARGAGGWPTADVDTSFMSCPFLSQ